MTLPSSGFVVPVVLTGIVFPSLGGLFTFADRDYRLTHTDTTVSIGMDDSGRDSESLDAHQRQIFGEATGSESYVSEVPSDFPDRVQRNDTYYDFAYTRSVDWTDPSTLLPTVTSLGGLLGVAAFVGRNAR